MTEFMTDNSLAINQLGPRVRNRARRVSLSIAVKEEWAVDLRFWGGVRCAAHINPEAQTGDHLGQTARKQAWPLS
jgi:hypothetical protein